MPFMSNPAGGDGQFTPYVKYNAKAGRFYTKEDKQDAQEFEVKNFVAVVDMANIKTGWFLFAAGVAPAKTYDPSLSQAAAKPGDGFKRGFEVLCFSEKNLLGVRELSSTAGAVIDSMNTLYDAWDSAPERAQGKLPVVKCANVTPVTNKHGTNYQPQFEIIQWVDRPAQLPDGEKPAPEPQKTAANHVPPPSKGSAAEGLDNDVEF